MLSSRWFKNKKKIQQHNPSVKIMIKKKREPACFSSGSFNFRLLFFRSNATPCAPPPSNSRFKKISWLIKKQLLRLLALEKFSKGEGIASILCTTILSGSLYVSTACRPIFDLKNILLKWYKHFADSKSVYFVWKKKSTRLRT